MNIPDKNPHHLPLRKAIIWICSITLLVVGFCVLGFAYFRYVRESYARDDRHEIVAIVQSCNEKENLKTQFFAEILDLSVDKPLNLYRFNSKEAKRKLLQNPLIKNADVKKIKPGTIYIDYSLRKPIAFLQEFSNTAIDKEGVAIPIKPFFTPKKLPEIIIGSDSEDFNEGLKWGKCLTSRELKLALALYQILIDKCCEGDIQIKRIDVSKSYASSYGQREIVVILEEKLETNRDSRSQMFVMPRLLRLSTEHIDQQLANYLNLRTYLNAELIKTYDKIETSIYHVPNTTIDLRIPQLAFINKVE